MLTVTLIISQRPSPFRGSCTPIELYLEAYNANKQPSRLTFKLFNIPMAGKLSLPVEVILEPLYKVDRVSPLVADPPYAAPPLY